MNQVAEELKAKLQSLDERRTAELSRKVREAIAAADAEEPPFMNPNIDPMLGVENGWPVGYFASTAGALAGEEFERPDQGKHQVRDDW